MLRQSLSADRSKGSANFNGPSDPSTCHWFFDRIVMRPRTSVERVRDGAMRIDKGMFNREGRNDRESSCGESSIKSRVVDCCEL